ncbi:Hypp7768 [Branchiostoma lanceolatum]|uniref:Hypp7768 protein n=1 Tax=Branchiostoma lanceolatum TaxID=7740 RepID=A0A8J9Z2W1_BRALA|nr:Hypp7768 [Branchiostoma lanceolatum]
MWNLKIVLLVLLSIGSSSVVEGVLHRQEKKGETQTDTVYNNNNNNNNTQDGGSQKKTGSEEPPSEDTVNYSILNLRNNGPVQSDRKQLIETDPLDNHGLTLKTYDGQQHANEARVERTKTSTMGSKETGQGKRNKRRARPRGARPRPKGARPRPKGARPNKRPRRPKPPKPKRTAKMKKKPEDQKKGAKAPRKDKAKLIEERKKKERERKKKEMKKRQKQKKEMERKTKLEDQKKSTKTPAKSARPRGKGPRPNKRPRRPRKNPPKPKKIAKMVNKLEDQKKTEKMNKAKLKEERQKKEKERERKEMEKRQKEKKERDRKKEMEKRQKEKSERERKKKEMEIRQKEEKEKERKKEMEKRHKEKKERERKKKEMEKRHKEKKEKERKEKEMEKQHKEKKERKEKEMEKRHKEKKEREREKKEMEKRQKEKKERERKMKEMEKRLKQKKEREKKKEETEKRQKQKKEMEMKKMLEDLKKSTKTESKAVAEKVTQTKKEVHGTKGPEVMQEKNKSADKKQSASEDSTDEGEGKGGTTASQTTNEAEKALFGILKSELLSHRDAEKKAKHLPAQERKEKPGHENWKTAFEKAVEAIARGRRRVESGLLAFRVAQHSLASDKTRPEVEWGKGLVEQGLQIVKEGEQQLKNWLGLGLKSPDMTTSKVQEKDFGLQEQSTATTKSQNSNGGGEEPTEMDWLAHRAKTSMDVGNGKNVKTIKGAVGGKEGTGALGQLKEGLKKIKEGLSLQEAGQKNVGTKSKGKQDKAKVQQGLEEVREGVEDVERGLNVVMVGKKEVEEGVMNIGDTTENEKHGEDVGNKGEDDLKALLGLNGLRKVPLYHFGGNPFVDPTPTEHDIFPQRMNGMVESTSPKPAQRTLFYPSYLQVPQAGTVPASSARSAPQQRGNNKSAGGKPEDQKRQALEGPTVPTSVSGKDLLKEIKELQNEVVELEAKKEGKGQPKKGRRHVRNVGSE